MSGRVEVDVLFTHSGQMVAACPYCLGWHWHGPDEDGVLDGPRRTPCGRLYFLNVDGASQVTDAILRDPAMWSWP